MVTTCPSCFDFDRSIGWNTSSFIELSTSGSALYRALIAAKHQGVPIMNRYAINERTIGEAVNGGRLLVVAQWEAKEGEADKVASILDRFLPEAQREVGAKLFLI